MNRLDLMGIPESEVIAELGHAPVGRVRLVRGPGSMGVHPLLVVRDISDAAMATPQAEAHTRQRILRSTELTHPGWVRIFGTMQVGRQASLMMELVAGCALPDLPVQSLTHATVSHIGAKVAAILQSLHRGRDSLGRPRHLVHGSVTPDKIMLSFGGDVKLLDFSVTQTTLRSLLPAAQWPEFLRPYAAPEQLAGGPPSPASDLFMLGATLYELLVGYPPARPGPGHSDPVLPPSAMRPDVPPHLDEMIVRLLDPHPQRRPERAQEVRESLDVGPARLALSELVRDAAPERFAWMQALQRSGPDLARPVFAMSGSITTRPPVAAELLTQDSLEVLKSSVQHLFAGDTAPARPTPLRLTSGPLPTAAPLEQAPAPVQLTLPIWPAAAPQVWRPAALLMVLMAALVLTFVTRPSAQPGELDLRTDPPEAQIERVQSASADPSAGLSPGLHRVRVTTHDHQTWDFMADLAPGEHQVIVVGVAPK